MKTLLEHLKTMIKPVNGQRPSSYVPKSGNKSSGKVALSYTLSLLSVGTLLGVMPRAEAATYTYDNATSGTINGSTICSSPLTRTFNVTDSFTVQDVNLGFNADHTYRGDIQVTLRHPDGTVVQVISSSGGDSSTGYDVLLDSGSGNALNDGGADDTAAPLYDRTAAPSNTLSAFNGKASNGTWTLEVCDTFPSGDNGTFNSAQLILDDTAPPIDASLPTGERPFSLRYSIETTGNIEATGNAILTCDTGLAACRSALSAGTAGNNNGGLAMQMLDVDSDGATFNSSSAQLTIPAGANVLFAGLYWGGTSDGATTAAPDASKRNEALLATPNSGYQAVTADTFTSMDNSGTTSWDVYNSFTDVTSLVQGAGSGTYTMANVQTSTGIGFTYPNAGWSLVVVYEDPTEPRRNLTVFDGYQFTGFGSSITNTLSGLRTPPTAGFDVFMGAVAGDGEVDQPGDFLAINGTQVSDALNPSTNFFNGTISKFGSHITTRTPNDPYNLVIDIDYLDLTSWNQTNNAIPTNATSIDVTLGTQGDGIWPMAYFFGVEVFEPNLVTRFEKTTPSTSYATGDVIPYTISVTNTGNDNATDTTITDAIPAGTTFVPGSLKIDGVTKTDSAGDDEAEFDGSNVVFRVGVGANATQGGQININDTVTMTFDVTVTAAPGDLVCNQATIDYEGQTSGNAASGNSDDPNTPTFGDCTEVTTTASAAKDYGDAPDSYGTDATDDSGEGIGPSHRIVNGIHLGATAPDAETDAVTPLDGTGDGGEDDGVTLPASIEQGTTISLPVTTTGIGVLNAWIDWNGDGVFDNATESVANDADVSGGTLSVTAPANATVGNTYARFRYSSQTGLTPGGAASDGEVEDYAVAIAPATSFATPQICPSGSGVYATWATTSGSNGTGTFLPPAPNVAVMPNYTWSITGERSFVIDSSEDFSGGNSLEPIYGEADNASNLNVRNESNIGVEGDPIDSRSIVTITFDRPTPASGWAFSTIDLDVDQVSIRATDASGNPVPLATIDSWFVEAFDADPVEDGPGDIPIWDRDDAALVGSRVPSGEYTNLIENTIGDTEAGAAWFQPNISLSTLTLQFDNKDEGSGTPSFHAYLASCVTPPSDYGDAPDSYGTDATDDSGEGIGPSHRIVNGIHLGATAPDAETDAVTPLDGTGDGGEDDGVTLPASIEQGTTISLPVTTTGIGVLNAWIDWNGDGVFDNATESVANDADVSGGTLSVTAPANATVGNTYARFRYSSQTGLTPGGAASDGEVEDYAVAIAPASLPPFSCDPNFYVSQAQELTDPTQLNDIDFSTSPFALTSVGAPSNSYNAIGYNPVDNYIYGVVNDASGTGNADHDLVKIGSDGSVVIIPDIVPDPGNKNNGTARNFVAGDVVVEGGTPYLYVSLGVANELHKINLSGSSPTYVGTVTLNATAQILDFAFNPNDGLLYSIVSQINSADRLLQINPTTGAVNPLTLTDGAGQPSILSGDRFGAVFFDSDNTFYAYNNLDATGSAGGLYAVDINNNNALSFLGEAVGLDQNDGARCPYASPPAVPPFVTSPDVVLVKRITAINGATTNPNDSTDLTGVVNDGTANSPDDEGNWPTGYLLGEIDAGLVKPGDQIEYTVYFLNTGSGDAENVRICDWIQPNQSLVTGLYDESSPGARDGNDIELSIGGTTYQLTAASDAADRAVLTTVGDLGSLTPNLNCNLFAGASTSDSVLVLDITGTTGDPTGLTTLPGTTAQGIPNNAYGFFRFTTQVDK